MAIQTINNLPNAKVDVEQKNAAEAPGQEGKQVVAEKPTASSSSAMSSAIAMHALDGKLQIDPALLAALSTLQATVETPTPVAGDSSAAAVAALSKLVELMGAPTGEAVSDAFDHDFFKDIASWNVTLPFKELHELSQMVKNIDETPKEKLPVDIKKWLKLADVVDKSFFKGMHISPELLKAKLPLALTKALEEAMPLIAPTLRAIYLSKEEAARKNPEIEIPSPAFSKLEKVMNTHFSRVGKMVGILNKTDPNVLRAAHDAVKSGKVINLPPEVVELVSEGKYEQLDVEALLWLVMMEGAKLEEDILRDTMKQVHERNMQKKAQREKLKEFKEGKAAADTAMRSEYNQLVSDGVVNAAWSFDDYAGWRSCAWGDGAANPDGTWAGPKPRLAPLGDIPAYFSEDPKAKNAAAGATAGAAEVTAGASFGLYEESQVNMLTELYNGVYGGKEGDYPSFDVFLKQVVGLKPAGSMKEVADNNVAVLKFLQNKVQGDVNANDPWNSLSGIAAPGSISPTDSAKNLKEMQDAILEVEMLKQAQNTGLPASPWKNEIAVQLLNAESKLKGLLAAGGKLLAADAKALQQWQTAAATEPNSFAAAMQNEITKFGDYMTHAIAYQDGLNQKVQDREYATWDNDEDDNFIENRGTTWGAHGPHTTIYWEWGEDSDEDTQATIEWGKKYEINHDSNSGDIDLGDAPEYAGGAIGDLFSKIASATKGIPWKDMQNVKGAFSASSLGGAPHKYPPDAPTLGSADAEPLLADGKKASYENIQSDINKQIHDIMALLKDKSKLNSKGEIPKDLLSSFDPQLVQALVQKGFIKLGKSQEELKTEENAKKQAKQSANAGSSEPLDAQFNQGGTLAELTAKIETLQGELDSLGEVSELDNMRLQAQVDRRAKLLEALSNIMKKMAQTGDTITGNLK